MKKNNNIELNCDADDQKPDYYSRNIDLINAKFNKEFSKYSHYIKINNDEALVVINKDIQTISNIKFDNVITELTPLNSRLN